MIQNKNQTGRSMIEMIAVLMIIGVITVGALAGLSQANDKYKIGKMHNDMQSISADIVSLYSWKRSYPNSNDSDFKTRLCENDVFPDGCTDGKAYNPYGGEYTVTTDTGLQTMMITADNIPATSCEDLRLREWAYKANVTPPNCSENPCCDGSGVTQTFKIVFN